MKKLISVICCMLALVLCLSACGQSAAAGETVLPLAQGGVLVLRVNPEIAVEYDRDGNVTAVTARNDDALAIISNCSGLIGLPTRDVVTDLVTAIGEAGYFVEEIEGERRQITLEIEPGSSLPSNVFLDDVIAEIRAVVSRNDWSTPLVVEGESDFGLSDYIDTDYGPSNDGVTDYSDYGTNNNGVTDYNDTDYGPNNDGVTDYSDYGTASNGSTDYYDSNTNYGDSIYGDSAYEAPAAVTPPANYGSSDSGYSNYDADSGYSNYDADSGYSDYEVDSGYSDYEGES